MLDGEDGNHIVVHFSEISPDNKRFLDGYKFLKQGQKVTFDLVVNPKLRINQKSVFQHG